MVEYDGFLRSGAATVAPWVQFDAATYSIGAQGSWTLFESGNSILQTTFAGSWFSSGASRLRAEASGSVGFSKYAETVPFGHALGRLRVHYLGETGGTWAGVATGISATGDASQSLELSVGGWTVRDRLAVVGSGSASWVGGERFVEFMSALRWSGDRIEVNAVAGARPWSTAADVTGAPRTEAYAELSGVITINERFAATLGFGRQPGDPARSLLASTYASAGIRIRLTRPRPMMLPVLASAVERAARRVSASDFGSAARLELHAEASEVVIRIVVARARTVELMGDFTDWQPRALVPVAGDQWELRLPLAPGAYRLNIRVDGGPWRVPLGTRLEETDFGGAAGVIVVR